MAHIIIGRPLRTQCGTWVEKYIENGILYKSIKFYQSTNKVAKQQGLKERVVKYQDKKPVEFTDTFERKIFFQRSEPEQIKYPAMLKIKYKKTNTKKTSCGTKFCKEIENGRLRKHVWFEDSTNRVAKEQGLMYTNTNFGLDLRPIEITKRFKKKTTLSLKEPKKQNNIVSTDNTGIKTEAVSEENYFGSLGADGKESFCEAYRKTDRRSVLYQDYDLFVCKVKSRLEKYEDFLPKELYQDIMNRYGYEEMSILKIMQDNSFDIDKMQIKPYQKALKTGFKNLITNTEKKEQEFSKIRLANKSEKLSVVYTNAWTHSKLRVDMGYETTKSNGNPWSILREVWLKLLNPNESEYKTEKLIDAYLIRMYSNRCQTGIMSYKGDNPLSKLSEDKEMNKKKVFALKIMYSGVKNLEKPEYKKILNRQDYQEFKKSADTEAMSNTIENFEEHYKNAFLKYFWTEERKFRFSEVLNSEINDFGEKIELSNDIYEALLKHALEN